MPCLVLKDSTRFNLNPKALKNPDSRRFWESMDLTEQTRAAYFPDPTTNHKKTKTPCGKGHRHDHHLDD